MPRELSLPPRDLFQVTVNFPYNPGSRNLMRKRSIHKQMPHFSAQEQYATPKSYSDQAKNA
jgi:hypothetical protein